MTWRHVTAAVLITLLAPSRCACVLSCVADGDVAASFFGGVLSAGFIGLGASWYARARGRSGMGSHALMGS